MVGGVCGGSGGGRGGQQTAAVFWTKFSGILGQAFFLDHEFSIICILGPIGPMA